jgi:site-specific DNA-methyltransferase (adenine-specific)
MTIQLLHGDCLEIMKTIPNKSIDLIICDLPYGCLTGGGEKEKLKRKDTAGLLSSCDWDVKIDLDQFWIQVKRIRRSDNSPTIHFCNMRFGTELIASNPTEFRYDLVWEKTNAVGFLCANKQPLRSHELMFVFSKKGAFYNRVDNIGDYPKGGGGRSKSNVYPSLNGIPNLETTQAGKRCVKSIIQVPNIKVKGGHPTAKPVELYKWIFERYCPIGGTILDPTFGSGNSVFTAQSMGLSSIGIEMNDAFFEKAHSRLEPENVIEHV